MIEEEGDELRKYMVQPTAPRAQIGNDIYKMKTCSYHLSQHALGIMGCD